MTNTTNTEQIVDELVRDLTQAIPRSKSEVRKRLQDLCATEHQRGVEDTIKKIIENVDDDTRQDLESYTFIQKLLPN